MIQFYRRVGSVYGADLRILPAQLYRFVEGISALQSSNRHRETIKEMNETLGQEGGGILGDL